MPFKVFATIDRDGLDGQRGFVENAGTVDECRNEIIDLLEGGEEAFELRRKRYGS
jgi:hypothetical protein